MSPCVSTTSAPGEDQGARLERDALTQVILLIHCFGDLLLSEFSTADAATFTIEHVNDTEYYRLHDQSLGISSAVDSVLRKMIKRGMNRYGRQEKRLQSGPFCEMNIPAKSFVFDVLVHDEIYPQTTPEFVIWDTSFEGVAYVNDPKRDRDRFHLSETVSWLGHGVDVLRIPEMPQHVQMLRHVFDTCGLHPAAFRTYRCRIEYPVYGSQVAIVFDRPIHAGKRNAD